MKKYKIYWLLLLILLGCHETQTPKKNDYIAEVGNEIITEEKVDSVISEQIYQLKKDALKMLLRKKSIELQSQKQNITKDDLLKTLIKRKNEVTIEQYNRYISKEGINPKSVDSIKIMNYLIAINKQKNVEQFADSLLENFDVKINLKPNHYKEVNLDDIYYHELSFGNKIIVYIISDYNCHACQNTEKRLRQIINKYGQFVSFRFVSYSEYIDRKALIAEAAANQNKFIKVHDFLFDYPEEKGEGQLLHEFAEKNGLNMKVFEEDIFNPNTLKTLIINKEKITKQNIYVTPSFIINNKLINDEFSLYTLENQINEELEKEK